LPVFVAHRIGEIQEFNVPEDWNHVGTRKNPADLVSREITAKELISSAVVERSDMAKGFSLD